MALQIKIIQCLTEGNIQNEHRPNDKNVFKSGKLSIDKLIEMIYQTTDQQYEHSLHHVLEKVKVYILKPVIENEEWYIKFYFIEPDCWFISVHKSNNGVLR